MKKETFMQYVNDGIQRKKDFMVVKIETDGNPGAEIIINPSINFDQKIRYYDNAYNGNMELIKAKESGKIIRVTDIIMTNNLHDLMWFAY